RFLKLSLNCHCLFVTLVPLAKSGRLYLECPQRNIKLMMQGERRLREPGLLRLDAGTERYRVHGGGATVLSLLTGDRLTITDLEGCQPCELVAFSRDGQEDTAALGVAPDSSAEGLRALLSSNTEGDGAIIAALGRLGRKAPHPRAVQLFGGQTRSGDHEAFVAQREVICV